MGALKNSPTEKYWAESESHPDELSHAGHGKSMQSEGNRSVYQKQVERSRKLEAIGTLAGGIAHDFNNILYAIGGYTELAMEDIPKDSQAYDNLEQALIAGKRASDLVNQILTFARPNSMEPKPVRLQTVLEEPLMLLKKTMPTNIGFKKHISHNCRPVLADSAQINLMIMNMGANACHAMRERGGNLAVRLDEIEVDLELAEKSCDLKLGRYARLIVSDTGHGMDKATLNRIFEPFFTTKKVGEGTGLGLSTVHGIVKSLNGAIAIQSEVGGGTVFEVFFPLLLDQPPMPHGEDEQRDFPKGQGRILFIDDEELIVRMGKRFLEHLGYDVLAFTSSTQALEVFCADPAGFDLVITDQTMPDMTGVELTRHLQQIRPDVKIVLSTGFSDVVDEQKAKAMGIREYLRKPIVMRDLAGVLQRLLKDSR